MRSTARGGRGRHRGRGELVAGRRSPTELGALLAESALDAVINLSPAPARIGQPAMPGGRRAHVYSEKPLAGTLTEADRLIATARERGVLLLCAPGVAVTRRFQWLAEIVASERYGALSLAVAHLPTLVPPRGASTPAIHRSSTARASGR